MKSNGQGAALKAFVLILGLAIFAIGLFVVGSSEITAYDGGSSARCGSALDQDVGDARDTDMKNQMIYGRLQETHLVDKCLEKIESQKLVSYVVMALGGAVFIGSVVWLFTSS